MRSLILILFLFVSLGAAVKEQIDSPDVFLCGKCDFIVKGYMTDGTKLHVKPGQIICFDAYMKYKSIRLQYIKGTPLQPVIIRNCNGVAVITEGLRVLHSENFKLLGDGDKAEAYGLKVSTHKSFFITFEEFTTDFEVAHVEVAGYNPKGLGENSGFAGMGIKTSPYQDCDLFRDSTRKAWVMRNVSVHDNYIHDVGGEGLYIGHGFYKGRKETKCAFKTYSHSIQGLRVYHNLVENTGYDGIQVKNADKDCEIYNNVIRNYGMRHRGAHNEGLMLADGVTGKAYNNLVDTGTGHGIMFQGMGNNEIFNNIVLNAGEDGFNGTDSKVGVYIPNGYFRIFNNTIYNSGDNGFVYFNNDGGEKLVMNNLVINSKGKMRPKGARLHLSNNIFLQDSTLSDIIDRSEGQLIIKPYLPAIDQGKDLTKICPQLGFDFYHHERPKGKAFDIGAIEFK